MERGLAAIVWGLVLVWLAGASAAPAQPVDPSQHWPLPPGVLERRLAAEEFRILSVSGGVGGVMGVKKLVIALQPSGDELTVKWKKAPRGDADGWNNTPRKEIAAYEIQKWFLDPPDYVVPTIVPRCIAFEDYGTLDPAPEANLPGTRCVMGALVIWIDEVTVPETLYDPERFRVEPLYAGHMADFNLLTYLIEHEDGREGNFLVSEIESERRIFSIDNGVAFGARMKNFFVPNWNEIRVPALRRETVERLRRIGPAELEALGVVAEMKADRAGVLRVVPATGNRDPKHGARVADGWIQLGLERGEIDALRRRLERLLDDVDAGRIELL